MDINYQQKEMNERMVQELFLKRVIVLGEINEKSESFIRTQIVLLNLASAEPITLIIDSTGGEIDPSFFIYDTVKSSIAPIIGIVMGKCYSAAIPILQACTTRLASPHSIFLLHLANTNVRSTYDKNFKKKLNIKQIYGDYITKESIDIIAKRSGNTPKIIEKWMTDGDLYEIYLPAKEALKRNLIDKIVNNPEDYTILERKEICDDETDH